MIVPVDIMADEDITVLLHDWLRGETGALERLTPLIYPELHALARSYLRRGARPVTLQTTAVVNELFVRLLASRPQRLDGRRHFYVLAARIIRMALVDHYRQTQAEKRGGQHQRVPLHEELAWVDADSAELLSFERALNELEQAKLVDPSAAFTRTEPLTLWYASPERLRGDPVSVACDVYSLGLILYELASGVWPFRQPTSIMSVAERAAGQIDIVPLSRAISDEAASPVVRSALVKSCSPPVVTDL